MPCIQQEPKDRPHAVVVLLVLGIPWLLFVLWARYEETFNRITKPWIEAIFGKDHPPWTLETPALPVIELGVTKDLRGRHIVKVGCTATDVLITVTDDQKYLCYRRLDSREVPAAFDPPHMARIKELLWHPRGLPLAIDAYAKVWPHPDESKTK